MSNFPLQFIAAIFASTIFIFFFWRRLKEDYKSEAIFTASLTIILITGILGFLSNFIEYSNLWFWTSFVGFFLSILIVQRRQKFKIFELYEAASRSAILFLIIIYIFDFLFNQYILSLYYAIFLIFVIFIFIYTDRSYRKFTWYHSGRVGIAGLVAVSLVFISRVILGVLEVPVISVIGRYEFIISGVIAFLNIFFVYHLSES